MFSTCEMCKLKEGIELLKTGVGLKELLNLGHIRVKWGYLAAKVAGREL